MKFKRIDLPFEYNALEPYIDAETVELHYEKHHKGYEQKLNDAFANTVHAPEFESLKQLMINYQKIEDPELRVSVREFGGGLINHNFYWQTLKPNIEINEDLELIKDIKKTWGSMENLKAEFKQATLELFGSGWTWLAKKSTGGLKIIRTFNQDNPWFLGFTPVFGIDVWEHAYYLKHKSNKGAHFDDIWNLIDWNVANEFYTGQRDI